MNNERQETVSDIVAEMRIGDLCAGDTTSSRPEYINDFLAGYADRIEAAYKREREAGAEAAQICGEIGEMIGREATTEKSSAVVNTDTVRGIAKKMLNTSMQSITAERINGWAVRLAAACEQTVTDCNHLGNAAAMRKALERLRERALMDLYENAFAADPSGNYKKFVKRTIKIAGAVLSAPPRNCDVGTAEEQSERYEKFCYAHRSREKGCGGCPLCDIVCCGFAWLQMPYEEGGARWAKQ